MQTFKEAISHHRRGLTCFRNKQAHDIFVLILSWLLILNCGTVHSTSLHSRELRITTSMFCAHCTAICTNYGTFISGSALLWTFAGPRRRSLGGIGLHALHPTLGRLLCAQSTGQKSAQILISPQSLHMIFLFWPLRSFGGIGLHVLQPKFDRFCCVKSQCQKSELCFSSLHFGQGTIFSEALFFFWNLRSFCGIGLHDLELKSDRFSSAHLSPVEIFMECLFNSFV